MQYNDDLYTVIQYRVNFHVCLYIEVSGKRRENDRYMNEYIQILPWFASSYTIYYI